MAKKQKGNEDNESMIIKKVPKSMEFFEQMAFKQYIEHLDDSDFEGDNQVVVKRVVFDEPPYTLEMIVTKRN